MASQTSSNTHSDDTLDKMHRLGTATTGRYYYNVRGQAYLGTVDGRLKRQETAVETIVTATEDIPVENVQEALELVNDSIPAPIVIADASVTTKGITRLSYPPVSAVKPIALGQNDPVIPFYALILG